MQWENWVRRIAIIYNDNVYKTSYSSFLQYLALYFKDLASLQFRYLNFTMVDRSYIYYNKQFTVGLIYWLINTFSIVHTGSENKACLKWRRIYKTYVDALN